MRSSALDAIHDLPVQEQVLQRIRDGIIQGTLVAGAALRIDRLAADLGVSHMPVREALHVLTVEGLAVRLPRRGVRVSSLTADDLRGAYEVMATIEGLAARLAAASLTEEALTDLRHVLAPAAAMATANDTDGLMRVNRQFHSGVYDSGRNRWVGEFCRLLWNYVYRLRRSYPQASQRLRDAVQEHQEILAALAERDGARAEKLVREHCARSRDDLFAQLAAAGLPGFAAAVPEATRQPSVRRTSQTRQTGQTYPPPRPARKPTKSGT